MLLKIISTTDGKYIGKYIEYNEVAKILTLPSGESIEVDEDIEKEEYVLSTSNYVINAVSTIN